MNLNEYTSIHTQRHLASKLGVHPSLVCQWLAGKTQITAERAVQIESATHGLISRHDLRPDLWPKPEGAV